MFNKRFVAVAVAAAVLAVPAAAAASNGHGKGQEKAAQKRAAKEQRKASRGKKAVSYVFKGTYKGDGVVTVLSGNAHVRKGGFVGQDVTFDLSTAKVVAAEFDNVAGLTAGDLQVGDRVVVQARLPRGTKAEDGAAAEGAEPAAIKARKVVDQTHPKAEEQEQNGGQETEAAPIS
jgi:opacity protein-like surface antigen